MKSPRDEGGRAHRIWRALTGSSHEVRAAPYSDAVIAAIIRKQGGLASDIGPEELAASETAAALAERCFLVADVTGDRGALGPWLGVIGRALVETGESVFEVLVDRGRVTLQPAADYEVLGSPRSWSYRLTFAGPGGSSEDVYRPAAAVFHPRMGASPQRPWEGRGAVERARGTADLSAAVEAALIDDAGIGEARIAPWPGDSAERDEYADALAGGGIVAVESASGPLGGGNEGQEPASRWRPQRVGAEAPAGLVALRSQVEGSMLASLGVPPGLFASGGTSGAAREALRLYLHGTLQALAEAVLMEGRDKLFAPGLSIGFGRLFASDLSGRARAFQSLVTAGMDPSKAASLAGLMEVEA